jgi:hypothetical protein
VGGVGWGNSSSKAFGISFADRPKAKNNNGKRFRDRRVAFHYCLCSGLVTELLAYIHTIILTCYNTKCSEKGALSGYVIQLSIKTLTSKFGK